MWFVAGLLAYAMVVATVGGWLIRRVAWSAHSPMLGVRTWQVTQASVLLSVAAAGLLMIGTDPIEPASRSVRTQTATDTSGVTDTVSSTLCLSVVVLSSTLLLLVGFGVLRAIRRAQRARDLHIDHLTAVARQNVDLNALVLDHDTAAAYCLAGSRPTVVLTSAAIALLDDDELRAVIVHEREHMRGRHDVQLAAAAGLRWALPLLPLFRWGHDEQARLFEMVADDAAAHDVSRQVVATAMVQMAELAAPEPALNVGGHHTIHRVHRLLAPGQPLGRIRAIMVVCVLALSILAPVGVAATPIFATTGTVACGIAGPAPH
ncbi:MAG TPA: hypothetical protein DCQ04_14765 [Actinobacteria bacterium]|nr:hypothetical protein [Actinomycetota bacterium]